MESANEDATSTWRCDISQVVVLVCSCQTDVFSADFRTSPSQKNGALAFWFRSRWSFCEWPSSRGDGTNLNNGHRCWLKECANKDNSVAYQFKKNSNIFKLYQSSSQLKDGKLNKTTNQNFAWLKIIMNTWPAIFEGRGHVFEDEKQRFFTTSLWKDDPMSDMLISRSWHPISMNAQRPIPNSAAGRQSEGLRFPWTPRKSLVSAKLRGTHGSWCRSASWSMNEAFEDAEDECFHFHVPPGMPMAPPLTIENPNSKDLLGRLKLSSLPRMVQWDFWWSWNV